MYLMSLAKRPLRVTRAGLVAGLAAVALVTTAGTAAAASATSSVRAATTSTDATTVRNGTGLRHLPEELTPAERAAEIFCRHLEHAARHGAVPEEALAFCKHVNGWD
ncbi:hypothetical protein SAMN05444921_109219 [Streptomyces wuyuanensis]|uniref:Secreted protein n=2 Tax=Streptomyces wuyuanensis TaxID=1196353 RepID=A0A1G9U0L7_9ACTN|nr:hypothetical protein SAMN05444921_109219 [Streptomyces wuyuanensis]